MLFLLPALFLLSGCRRGAEKETVSVTILPQKYLVERVAGELMDINVLVPPGMNPATCDLTTGVLKKLHDSRICFTVGNLPFETAQLYPVLQGTAIEVIRQADGLELMPGSCGHAADPHVWFTPRNAVLMAEEICRVLGKTYPGYRERFAANLEQLRREFAGVDSLAAAALAGKAQRSFLIYHPALTYFAGAYGLEQLSIEEEGKEPSPGHLKKLVDRIREQEIPLVFVQSQFDTQHAESIARETGIRVVPIDPLSPDLKTELLRVIRILSENLR
jgi:zinc transport system substrate-binding protein